MRSSYSKLSSKSSTFNADSLISVAYRTPVMSQADFVCFGRVKKARSIVFGKRKACINYIERVNDLLNRIQVGSPTRSVNSVLLFGPESSSVALAAFVFITIHITLGKSHIANVKRAEISIPCLGA